MSLFSFSSHLLKRVVTTWLWGDYRDEVGLGYEPLATGGIRLLGIAPGDWDAPIQCYWGQSPTYIAVSYTWGDTSDRMPIMIKDSTVLVTRNCFALLRQLRKDNRDILYWIDAICINQEDHNEKSIQVRMMKSIFSFAETVLCWLGEESPTDREGVELLMNLHFSQSTAKLPPEFQAFYNQASSNRAGGPALWSIYTRPWFHRIWIIQEVTVAREAVFRIGELHVPSAMLFEVAEYLWDEYYNGHCLPFDKWKKGLWSGARDVKRLKEMWDKRNVMNGKLISPSGTIGLEDSLRLTQYFEQTDKRDRIFALVGLDSTCPDRIIDYSKTWDEACESLLEHYRIPTEHRQQVRQDWRI